MVSGFEIAQTPWQISYMNFLRTSQQKNQVERHSQESKIEKPPIAWLFYPWFEDGMLPEKLIGNLPTPQAGSLVKGADPFHQVS